MNALRTGSTLMLAFLLATSVRAQATPASDARLAGLEKKVADMQRAYEARIAALEAEVASLKVRATAGSPGAPNAASGAPPSPGAQSASAQPRDGGTSPPAAPAGPPSAAQAAAPQVTPPPPVGAPAAAPSPPPASDLEAQPACKLSGSVSGSPEQAPLAPSIPAPAPAWSPAQAITIAGGAKNYLNLSLDALVAGGSSSTPDLASIETGGHDPSQRGFTVQNVEAVFDGAVDPYFRGQANVVLQIDAEGKSTVELEEAYLTSTSLPANLQLKAGTFFSEFGRLNAQHPHTWDFVDQPLVNGRLMGPDGLRNPGVRVSWLMLLGFYSELFLSVQDSQGETAASFRGEPGDVFAGRPIESRDVRSLADLLYVPRWSGSFDLTSNQTLVTGASAAFGPNGTGGDTSTRIYGADVFWKWKAANAQAGFPF